MPRRQPFRFAALLLPLLAAACACAQQATEQASAQASTQASSEPRLSAEGPQKNPQLPTVTFSFKLEGGTPSYYAIAVQSDGKAAYRSDAPEREAAEVAATPSSTPQEDPFVTRFVMSQAARERVFQIAQQLDYFHGDWDYRKTRIANMGAKTLIYADPQKHFETSYNWSQNPLLAEVTKLFQGVSATLEFGRQLQDHSHYGKLALDDDLKRMEDAANDLAELQAIQPVLEKIVHDKSIMHVARVRAQRLLDKIAGANGAGQPAPPASPR